MKKSRFTESQIVSAIKKHEGGISAKEIAREMGVSEAAFYQWKAKYGGMEVKQLCTLAVAAHRQIGKNWLRIYWKWLNEAV